jgi:hypothetical protein
MEKVLPIVEFGVGDDPLCFEERDGTCFDDELRKVGAVEGDPTGAMSGWGDSTEERLALAEAPRRRRGLLPFFTLAPWDAPVDDDPMEMTASFVDVVMCGIDHREEETRAVLHNVLGKAVSNATDDVVPACLKARRFGQPLLEDFGLT